MTNQADLDLLLDRKIVAILRAPDGARLVEAAEALVRGGVDIIEITFTVPGAARILEQLVTQLGERAMIGAGTVLDEGTARVAMLAGARFIVTPVLKLDVIATCRRYGKLVLPGALTPTEILTAWEAGADVVKVFPSEVTGPAYLKALRGPLPQIRLMPTGGVNLQTAAAFLQSGACALGIGGSLVEAKALAEGDMTRIESLAREYVEVVRHAARGH